VSEPRATDSLVLLPESRVRELEAQLLAAQDQLLSAQDQIAQLEQQQAKLRSAYERLWQELELLKRRLFVAKAERVDTRQLELEFAAKLQQLDEMAGTLGLGQQPDDDPDNPGPPTKTRRKRKPSGRRDLKALDLPEVRLELADELFEGLVAQGQATRIGFEESCKLAWQRGGMRRLVLARVKYQAVEPSGKTAVETTPLPAQLFPRILAAPSLLAHALVSKYNDGLPFWRLEEIFARDGLRLDRGTLWRWAEDAGSTLDATVVEAMRRDARQHAFCIAADATGIAVQPERQPGGGRQACRRGHYFVMIADRDHIWFEYTAKETSAAVKALFQNFAGYVQVDAKSVFDALFRDGPAPDSDDDTAEPPRRLEVGCWSHARRKYWEAALARSPVAREALARIARIFELDASWQDQPPVEIKRRRQLHLRPHVEAFLDWAAAEYELVRETRGTLPSALGYTVRQRQALARFLEDGRLKLDNNRSERALRGGVAIGRKAWLFVGSDAHAEAAAGTMSLVASARLHHLDPETYLRHLFRVLPHWPKERLLELSPKCWATTRDRLDSDQLAAEFGALTVPDPLPPAPTEQPTTH